MPRPTTMPHSDDPKTLTDHVRRVIEHEPATDDQILRTVVGNPDLPDAFYPHIRFSRWDEECWVELRLNFNSDTFQEQLDYDEEGRLVFTHSVAQARFYPLGDGSLPSPGQEGYGGYEVDVVLSAKPAQNSVSFQVVTHNCTLQYQPTTDEQVAAGAEAGSFETPPYAEASYSVYANSDDLDRRSHNQYRTGKVCHLYRPIAIDANGDQIYCDYNKDAATTGVLTVTVDRNWLRDAAYPVVIDPTAGYSTKGSSLYNASLAWNAPLGGVWPHFDESEVFTADQTASEGHVWVTGSGTPVNARFVIYDNGASILANYDLIGQTDKSTMAASSDTQIDWSCDILCPSGSAYIGGFVLNGAAWDDVKIYYDSSTNSGTWLHSTAVIDAMPATLASASKSGRRNSIWWTYDVAGGGPGPHFGIPGVVDHATPTTMVTQPVPGGGPLLPS